MQRVGVTGPVGVRLTDPPRFELRSTAPLVFSPRGDAQVYCRDGAEPRPLASCAACPRFVGLHLDGRPARVRCRWSHTDPVEARMSPLSAFLTVSQALPLADAAIMAELIDAHYLLVGDENSLAGVVSRGDLERRDRLDTAGDCLVRELLTIAPQATLGEAAAAMGTLGVGCLPVVDDQGRTLGVLLRSHLVEIGVPEALLHPTPG